MQTAIHKAVELFCDKENLFGKRLLVAVSGGVDSMLLLHYLLQISKQRTLQLACIHFHHGLRPESDVESAYLLEFSQQMNFPLYLHYLNVNELAQRAKISQEMAAHDLRYEQFHRYLKEDRCDYILTAHHRDDLVESIMMNIARGAGRDAILGLSIKDGAFLKPFLPFDKQSILQDAKSANLHFFEDRTNEDTRILRNFWRHKVLPLIESRYQGQFVANVLKTVKNLGHSDYDTLWMKQIIADILSKNEAPEFLISEWQKYGSSQRKKILETILSHCLNKSILLNMERFNQFESFLHQGTSRKDLILASCRLIRYRGKIRIEVKSENNPDIMPLTLASGIIIAGMKIKLSEVSQILKRKNSDEFFDLSLCRGSFSLRRLQGNEKFRPLGCKGTMKVNRFFKSVKLEPFMRDKHYGLFEGENCVSIIGYRLSDDYKISDKTTKIAKLEWTHVRK